MNLILKFIATVIILVVLSMYLPGVSVANIYIATIVVIILGLINTVIKPLLVLLTLPIQILTLGLFSLIINAGLILFVASFVKGFYIAGFKEALILTLAISAVNLLMSKIK